MHTSQVPISLRDNLRTILPTPIPSPREAIWGRGGLLISYNLYEDYSPSLGFQLTNRYIPVSL